MTKLIIFYEATIELALRLAEKKEVSRFVRDKLEQNTFYVQKKRNGSYIYYCHSNNEDSVPLGYYICEFTFTEPPHDDAA